MNIIENLEKKFIVKNEHSAKNVGSGDLDVLSTPILVAYIEETCKDIINMSLNNDELGSVGSKIELDHLAPSKIKNEILIKAKVKEIIKEKIIIFDIIAIDNTTNKKIGIASHTRVIINNKKFLEKLGN